MNPLALAPLLHRYAQDEGPSRAERAQTVCLTDGVETPGAICRIVYQITGMDWLSTFVGAVVPGLVKIALVLAIAYLASRISRRLIKRFIRGLTQQGLERFGTWRQKTPLADTTPIDLSRATMRTETIGGVLRSLATIIIWGTAGATILGVMAVPIGPLIASAGIAGVAIGFGAQNLVRDFLSGLFMLLEDQYGVGDIVNVGEASGLVESISLRTTRLRDVSGTVWHVPNGEIRRVGNMSQQWARALLDISVAYDTDLNRAIDVIKGTADELAADPEWSDRVLDEPEVWGVENFGASEILIRLVVKTVPMEQWNVNRELRRRLKFAFDEAGIEIPFPQRTVWLRNEVD